METKPTIGILAGSFDIIHPGYVKLFKEFNDACEYQFILLQDDPTIERPTKLGVNLKSRLLVERVNQNFQHTLI